jgi:hypothetical protein
MNDLSTQGMEDCALYPVRETNEQNHQTNETGDE